MSETERAVPPKIGTETTRELGRNVCVKCGCEVDMTGCNYGCDFDDGIFERPKSTYRIHVYRIVETLIAIEEQDG